MPKALRAGLIGFGTIGTGVVKLLQRNRAEIAAKAGMPIDLVRIADVETERDRGVRLPRGVLVPDARLVLDDPEIDVVIELVAAPASRAASSWKRSPPARTW